MPDTVLGFEDSVVNKILKVSPLIDFSSVGFGGVRVGKQKISKQIRYLI